MCLGDIVKLNTRSVYSQAESGTVFFFVTPHQTHCTSIGTAHQSNKRKTSVACFHRPPTTQSFVVYCSSHSFLSHSLGTLTLQKICLNCLLLFMIDWYLKYLLCYSVLWYNSRNWRREREILFTFLKVDPVCEKNSNF